MVSRKNKKGRYSENLSKSKEPWETGRGARRIGNPRFKPVVLNGKKTYVLRKRKWNYMMDGE